MQGCRAQSKTLSRKAAISASRSNMTQVKISATRTRCHILTALAHARRCTGATSHTSELIDPARLRPESFPTGAYVAFMPAIGGRKLENCLPRVPKMLRPSPPPRSSDMADGAARATRASPRSKPIGGAARQRRETLVTGDFLHGGITGGSVPAGDAGRGGVCSLAPGDSQRLFADASGSTSLSSSSLWKSTQKEAYARAILESRPELPCW